MNSNIIIYNIFCNRKHFLNIRKESYVFNHTQFLCSRIRLSRFEWNIFDRYIFQFLRVLFKMFLLSTHKTCFAKTELTHYCKTNSFPFCFKSKENVVCRNRERNSKDKTEIKCRCNTKTQKGYWVPPFLFYFPNTINRYGVIFLNKKKTHNPRKMFEPDKHSKHAMLFYFAIKF